MKNIILFMLMSFITSITSASDYKEPIKVFRYEIPLEKFEIKLAEKYERKVGYMRYEKGEQLCVNSILIVDDFIYFSDPIKGRVGRIDINNGETKFSKELFIEDRGYDRGGVLAWFNGKIYIFNNGGVFSELDPSLNIIYSNKIPKFIGDVRLYSISDSLKIYRLIQDRISDTIEISEDKIYRENYRYVLTAISKDNKIRRNNDTIYFPTYKDLDSYRRNVYSGKKVHFETENNLPIAIYNNEKYNLIEPIDFDLPYEYINCFDIDDKYIVSYNLDIENSVVIFTIREY